MYMVVAVTSVAILVGSNVDTIGVKKHAYRLVSHEGISCLDFKSLLCCVVYMFPITWL